jgi:type II secretory pathway pseudopilin PulG
MNPIPPMARRKTGGFTLAEMAVVLVIVALLIGGMILPLSAQQDLRTRMETQKSLAEIQEAILGFAATQGRLPCPASPAATGVENPVGGGACINPLDGFVPGITLGVQPVDTQGYAIDAWGQRIRYAVSTIGNTFTTVGGMNTTGLAGLNADLRVCSTAAGIFNNAAATPPGPDCAAGAVQTTGAVMILLSTGKNGATGGVAADEAANLNGDRVFVAHEPVAGANEFDDLIFWMSSNLLVNRLVSAGRLP